MNMELSIDRVRALNNYIAKLEKQNAALSAALKRFMEFDGRYGALAGNEKMDDIDFAFNLENLRKQGRKAIEMAAVQP